MVTETSLLISIKNVLMHQDPFLSDSDGEVEEFMPEMSSHAMEELHRAGEMQDSEELAVSPRSLDVNTPDGDYSLTLRDFVQEKFCLRIARRFERAARCRRSGEQRG